MHIDVDPDDEDQQEGNDACQDNEDGLGRFGHAGSVPFGGIFSGVCLDCVFVHLESAFRGRDRPEYSIAVYRLSIRFANV